MNPAHKVRGYNAMLQDAGTRRGGMPRIALPRYPQSLDPAAQAGWEEGWVSSLIYDAPLRATAEGAIVAGMAVSAGVDDQGTVVELTTRNSVFFPDGTIMTAEDIAWSIEQAAARSSEDDVWRWEQLDAVEVADDGGVVLRLRQPDATMPATLASTLVPVVPAGASFTDGGFSDLPPGTGPYVPASDDGSTLRFRRNGWHWVVGRPRFNGVTVIAIEQEIERTTSLVTGLADVAPDVPSLDIPLLESDERITLYGGISRRMCAMSVRMDREPLNDVRVRRLLASAIDRASLVELATAGTARAADWLFAPEHWAGPLDAELPGQEPAMDTRNRFAALGLLPGWSLRLVCPEEQPGLANAAILLQEQLAAAGVALVVDLLDAAGMREATDAGEFDLAMAYLPLWIDPHEVAYPWLHSEGRRNRSAYASVRMDRTLALARVADDPDQRGALYRDAQRLVTSEVPLIPLFATPWFDGLTSRINGYGTGLPMTAEGLASAWFANP